MKSVIDEKTRIMVVDDDKEIRRIVFCSIILLCTHFQKRHINHWIKTMLSLFMLAH